MAGSALEEGPVSHSLDEIFRSPGVSLRLEFFPREHIAALDANLFGKRGKPYLKCLAPGKDLPAKPEEIVRQLRIRRLAGHFGYGGRIKVEVPITSGHGTSKSAGIAVYGAGLPTIPYIAVEVKKPTAKDGKEQLKSCPHATGAPLAVWNGGTQAVVWHRKNPNLFEVRLICQPGRGAGS